MKTPAADDAPSARVNVLLRILLVQLPREQRGQAAEVWQQLREDVVDSATQQALYRNGLRVAVGRTERWDDLRAALDRIEGRRIRELPALHHPPGVPLALELDLVPRDQTIFHLEPDGILSGQTWLASQRVLRLTYALELRDLNRVNLAVVPEIRRRHEPALQYTSDGWSTGSRRTGRSFPTAAFSVELGSSEFLLIAPGEKADLFGLIGGAFLTERVAGESRDSYVFIRAEVNYVHERR